MEGGDPQNRWGDSLQVAENGNMLVQGLQLQGHFFLFLFSLWQPNHTTTNTTTTKTTNQKI